MEKAALPAAVTLLGLGALPHDHPLYLGMVGMHAARFTNMLLDECDLLVGLGVRFDDRATGKAAEFCPHVKFFTYSTRANRQTIRAEPRARGRYPRRARRFGAPGCARQPLPVDASGHTLFERAIRS